MAAAILTLKPSTKPSWSMQARIESALITAAQMKHHAWKCGPASPYTGCTYFEVYSNHESRRYVVAASPTGRMGGYKYLPGQPYLSCSCAAWTEWQKPCCHCGRVALRLQREARANRREGQPEAAPGVVCPRCAAENEPGAIYCAVCSHHVSEACA